MATIEEYELFQAGSPVIVGVSGGPDSLTLLHVLEHLQNERSAADKRMTMKPDQRGFISRLLRMLPSAVLFLLLLGCSQPVLTSVDMMDEAEARWQTDPTASYHIVVDVERPDDRRRSELTVRDGEIVEATVRYWDGGEEEWGRVYDLNQEQAFPFTVPGLYDMVRGAIRDSGRVDVRVVMEGEPAFPHHVVMGPVWQDDRPVPGTEAEVIVRQFEVLE